MKKLLSIVLALALVLGMLPVFAAETFDVEMTGAKNLKHYGFIQGDQNGDLGEMKNLTREQLTIVLSQLYGKYDEAKAFEAASGFADEAKFPKWSKNFISYAKSQKWMVGDKSNNFNNKGIVSDKALATVLLRVLEYPETEFTWKTAVDVLKAKTGIEIAGDKLTRGEAFEAIWKAVSTPVMFVKEGEAPKYLGVEVGKLDIAIITPPVKDLAIDSVSADNLKEIKVNFNQPVNKDKLGSFELNNKVKVESFKLDEQDASVVYVTVAGKLADQKEYVLTVKDTEAVDEKAGKLAKTEVKFSTLDKERPTVEKVEFSGPKHVTVTFSEPINKDAKGKPEVRMGNVKLNVDLNNITVNGKAATFKVYGNFKEGTEYKILVKDFKDFNGLQNIEKEEVIAFSKNTEAPVATILSADQESIIVEFSKGVTGLKPELFHHTFSKYVACDLEDMDEKAVDATKEYSKIKVVFYTVAKESKTVQPIKAGDAKFMIDGDTIKDLWGNKLGNQELKFLVEADMEAPAIKEIKAIAENQIKVTFTKEVKVDKKKSFSVMLDKKDVLSNVDKAEGKEFVLTLDKKYAGKTVSVEIDKVKDTTVNANKFAAETIAVTIGDTTPPEVAKVAFKDDKDPAKTGGMMYVFFNDDVDNDTALNATNYKLIKDNDKNHKSLAGSAIEFYDGANVVSIKLDKDMYALAKINTTKLYVDSVKDLAGNKIEINEYLLNAPFATTLNSALELATTEIKATGLKTLVVTFNQEIDECQNDAIKVDGVASESVEINGKVVTATFKANMTDADKGTFAATKKASFDPDKVTGRHGVKATAVAGLDIVDKIQPRVTGISRNDAGELEITLDKELAVLADANKIANDVKVFVKADADADYTQLNPLLGEITFAVINANDKKITATVNVEGIFKVVVKDSAYVKSLTANTAIANQEFVSKDNDGAAEALDLLKPVVESVNIDDTKLIVTIKFNEPLHIYDTAGTLSAEIADATSVKDYITVAGTGPTDGSCTAVYKTGGTIVVTLDAVYTAANGTIAVQAHGTKSLVDKAGNAVEIGVVVKNSTSVAPDWNTWVIE